MVDGYASGRRCTGLFFLHTEIAIVILGLENLKVFRKNCGMAVLGSFLDYQMLPDGCLLLKTRAPYLAEVHVIILVSQVPCVWGCHRRGQPPRTSWYVSLAISPTLMECYLLFFVL